MYGECAGNFLNVQEFQAKRKKFQHTQLAHVQEEYEEALNYSCTCQKYRDFTGIAYTFSFLPVLLEILPTLFKILPTHEACFQHICECAGNMLPALLHVQEGFQ